MLNRKYMFDVLRGGDLGEGSVTIVIAVVVVLSSGVPVVQHILLCQSDIQCETDSSIVCLAFCRFHVLVNIYLSLC